MVRRFRNAATTALVAGALALAPPLVEAGYTAVNQPKRKTDLSHERIIERVYGGNFVADATGLSFANESGVTVTRLDDGPAGDVAFAGRTISARVVAAFSGRRKTAAYFGVDSGGKLETLFALSGRHLDVTGAGQSAAPVSGNLVLVKNPRNARRAFSSLAPANRDSMDQMVAYEVKGTAQRASLYLLCWEDKFAGRSDRDYNDMVVEIEAREATARAAMSQPLLIPLPPGAWTGAAGLASLALLSWTRRRPLAG